MNYLQIVNKVLVRLRENEVTSVQDTPYSKLIGEFVNIVKREVETSWDWTVLRETITVPTVASTYTYSLTGMGVSSRVLDVSNETNKFKLMFAPREFMHTWFLTNNVSTNTPTYYNLQSVDSNGYYVATLFPIPNDVYSIKFDIIKPQVDLSDDTDELKVPYQVVVEGALARAISERGDDGGYTEQEARYNRVLSDYIAIDAGHHPEDSIWYAA